MDHLEAGVVRDTGEVAGRAGGQVVEDDDLVALGEQQLDEVAPDESGAAGDEGLEDGSAGEDGDAAHRSTRPAMSLLR